MSAGQVKLRRQRVELGEIEEVALKTTGLTLAIASLIDDSLVVFCSTDSSTTVSQVQSTCKSWLPIYMRPSEIILSNEDLPRLPSGKVDKKRLEDDHAQQRYAAEDAGDEALDDEASLLANVLSAILGVTIRRHTDLWSVGLDSLKAIKAASELPLSLPQLTVGLLLEEADVADIIRRCRQSQVAMTSSSHDNIEVQPDRWQQIRTHVEEGLTSQQLLKPSKILP